MAGGLVTRRLEKDIERSIIGALRRMGCAVYSLSQPRKTKQTEGLPDLYVVHVAWGLAGWIEVKRPGRSPGPHSQALSGPQARFRDDEQALGRCWGVATSVEDAVHLLNAWGAPIDG